MAAAIRSSPIRRADRLFEIIQIVRRERRAVTAAALAHELECSVRSVYRDISALMARNVPIRGEAGVGYVLDDGFDLPPLMLRTDELEALAVGVQWVASRADPELATAARNLLAKVEAVIPSELRSRLNEPSVAAAPPQFNASDAIDMAELRAHVRRGLKIRLRYVDLNGRETQRTVWPFLIGYLENHRMLIAWCETRQDFRTFRADRIMEMDLIEERYPERPALLARRWRAQLSQNACAAA